VILLDNMPVDFLTTYIQKVRAVTPDDIMEAATRYLTPENLREVIVGGK
jgi:zinc protease